MTLLYKKFCTPCAPFAASAASRFLLMDSILLLRARSNLSACIISNVHDQISLVMFTFPIPTVEGLILHTKVLFPKAWVNNDFILIFTPTLVPGLTTKLVIGLELYTSRFCCVRLQLRNHELVID